MPGRGDGRGAAGIGDWGSAGGGKRVDRVCRGKEMTGRNREEGGGVRGGAAERHRADRRGADRGPREQRGTAGAQRARTGGPKSMQDNRRGRLQSEGGASQSGHRKEGCRGWRVTQTGGRGAARAERERAQTAAGSKASGSGKETKRPPGVKRAGAGKRVPGAGKSQNGCRGGSPPRTAGPTDQSHFL